jgi:FkbH-like protein
VAENISMTDLRIALVSNATIELFKAPLAKSLDARGVRASIWVGGFGQCQQDVLNPASGLYTHDPGWVILHLDGADLFQELLNNPFDGTRESRRELALSRAGEAAAMAETLSARLPRATLLLNTAAIDPRNALVGMEYNSDYGLQDAVNIYNAELSALAHRLPNVVVVDIASLAAKIGFENWYDSRMWYLARSRWSSRALQALAERYTAAIFGRLGRIRKCVVVDLDNTLWGGLVGEDGFEGVRLGEQGVGLAYAEFQLELLNLYRKGVLLAICSKNNSDEALSIIRNHPSMRLREEHFAAMRINWDDKASNLRAMAEELNISLDSLIFLDDNPVERSWVRQAAPQVLVPDWPADPANYKNALLDLSERYLHKLGITSEDRRRGQVYQAQAERRKFGASAASLEDFYRGLAMRARIGVADSFSIPRVAQLTQKTNQFNLTTRRYTEAEIRAMAEDPNCAVWSLDLADRFGPNGIVGVLILRCESPHAWMIDTFLLSCRVMGRTVETAFLAAVSREIEAHRLVGEFRPTDRNAPVRELYPSLGFKPWRQDPEGSQFWHLDLTTAPLAIPEWFHIDIQPGNAAGSQRLPSPDASLAGTS